jgi:hypothetical protein
VITGGVYSIRTFNVVDKVCRLVSIGVRLIYIILPGFFTLKSSFRILGVQVPFVESFISKVLQVDFNNNTNFPMLVDPKAAFVMF